MSIFDMLLANAMGESGGGGGGSSDVVVSSAVLELDTTDVPSMVQYSIVVPTIQAEYDSEEDECYATIETGFRQSGGVSKFHVIVLVNGEQKITGAFFEVIDGDAEVTDDGAIIYGDCTLKCVSH